MGNLSISVGVSADTCQESFKKLFHPILNVKNIWLYGLLQRV